MDNENYHEALRASYDPSLLVISEASPYLKYQTSIVRRKINECLVLQLRRMINSVLAIIPLTTPVISIGGRSERCHD